MAKRAPRKPAPVQQAKTAKAAPARKTKAAAKSRAAAPTAAKTARASAGPAAGRCAAADPFGGPCQNLVRRPSAYCTIHSYLDR